MRLGVRQGSTSTSMASANNVSRNDEKYESPKKLGGLGPCSVYGVGIEAHFVCVAESQ